MADHAQKLFKTHEETLKDLLLESVHQNFNLFITKGISDLDLFFTGASRSIASLLYELQNSYLIDNRITKERLILLTKYRDKIPSEISYEEIILEFPIGHALFELNLSFHTNLGLLRKLNTKQKDDFAKGLCLGSHITTFFIFIVFRYEVFQDLTFLRLIRSYTDNHVYLSYPELLNELALKRTERFDHKIIFDQRTQKMASL